MIERNITFSPPDITVEEINEVAEALKSGWITTGPRTKKFEIEIAKYVGVNKAVCLNSSTAAMELSLRIFGVGPGDEVITSAYTYTASASVINHVGAKIVLVDTAPDSFEMDYEKVAAAITYKTKAIIPVDIAGVMCDYNKIFEIVQKAKSVFRPNNVLQKKHGRILILADAAHSFGATSNNKNSGQAADITCFSFHAVKNLTTAEGGAAVWTTSFGLGDEELYKKFMLLSLHGQSKDALSKAQRGSWEYDIIHLGYKCNMTDILAAVGLIQLKRYQEILSKRFDIINKYEEILDKEKFKLISHKGEDFRGSGHLMLINLIGISEVERNDIIVKLANQGISTNVHYKPLPLFTAYKELGFTIKDYPNAFSKYVNEISLPLHTCMTTDDAEYIAKTLNCIIDKKTNI